MALFDQPCSCSDCEAAVSPAAYLTVLLDYTLKHLWSNKARIELPFLVDTFRQPFADLPTDCGAVDREVRQVRLCIEVLRSYLGSGLPPDPVKAADLEKAEAQYRFAAYVTLLNTVGTSYDEIRRVRTDTQDNRRVVASRLGIDLTEPRLNDELDRLFLDLTPDVPSNQVLTEQALERLFGFVDTTRNPLSEGVRLGDDKSQITRWNLDGVAWGQNTDPEGLVYVTLTSPAPTAFRVELHQDSARTTLVAAGEIATSKGTLKLVPGPDSRLSGVMDIDYRADSNAISIAAVPSLLSWRLKHLRTQWSAQDHPADAYSNGATPLLPIIDPDVIGPDDFRSPAAKTAGPDQAFDLWLARRKFVDDTLSSLKASRETQGLEEILEHVLGNPLPALDELLVALTTGATSAEFQAAKDTLTALNLAVDGFTRLMTLRAKHRLAEADPRSDKVADAEWLEVYSILTGALKQRAFAAWRVAEASTVHLGPLDFWNSVTEPAQGEWPPRSIAGRPLVDPDIVALTDLPDWLAGRDAISLWNARKATVAKIPGDLKRELNTNGFDAMLRLALGHPGARDPLEHDVITLLANLGSTNQTDRDAAAAQIIGDFHLTVEAFKRVMKIRAADAQGDPAKKPLASEWTELFTILAPAHKVKHEYSSWLLQESTLGLTYWKALKARLPLWLASAGARQAWQQALRIRSQPPIIDPTLMGADDLRSALAGGAAFVVWKDRLDRLTALHDQLKASREATAPDSVKGLDDVAFSALGFGSADLASLDQERRAGKSIAKRLTQLNLATGSFNYLLSILELATAGQTIAETEWETVYGTLTKARLARDSARMRAEEHEKNITLGPDWFQIPKVVLTPLPYLDQFAPRWLSTWQGRREWQETLQARIDQSDGIVHALEGTVGSVEDSVLPVLRDALIVASDAAGADFAERAEWITARLLIDARSAGSRKVTRVAQAMETLQTLIFELRTGQFTQLPSSPLSLIGDNFDDEWKWIGSYAPWRSAMFVTLYPENLLQPSLLKDKTQPFKDLISDTRGARLSPDQACKRASSYADYFRDICTLEIEATCQASTQARSGDGCGSYSYTVPTMFYMFGRGVSGKIYWSAWSALSGYPHGLWREIDGFSDVTVDRIVGAMPYRKWVRLDSGGTRTVSSYINVFCLTDASGTKGLRVARLNLDRFGEWAAPVSLDLSAFNLDSLEIIPVQSYDESFPGGLVFHTRNSAGFYMRRLNRDGTDWEPGGAGWQSFLNTLPLGWKTIRAVVWVKTNVYWFVLKYYFSEFDPEYTARMIAVPGNGQVASDLNIGTDDLGEVILGVVPGDAGTVVPGLYVFSRARADSPGTRYVHVTAEPGSRPFHDSLANLTVIPPHSGRSPTQGHQTITYRRETLIGAWPFQSVQRSFYMYRYTESGDAQIGSATIRAVPTVRGDFYGFDGVAPGTPLTVPLRETSAALQQRRIDIAEVFSLNADAPLSVLQYFREAYYFVPLHLALALQSAGHHLASLDCFRTFYDYEAPIGPPNQRNIYYGLELDAALPDVPVYHLADNWLLDPLNPHAIAATRPYAYTRFTVMSLVRCLLDFADSEFTRDTGESLANARPLYLTATELLSLPELQQKLGTCDNLVAELQIQPGQSVPPEVPAVVNALIEDLTRFGLHGSAELVKNVKTILDSAGSWQVKLADAKSAVYAAWEGTPVPKSIGTIVIEKTETMRAKQALLLRDGALDAALQDVSQAISATRASI